MRGSSLTQILLKPIQNKEIKPYSTKLWNFYKNEYKNIYKQQKINYIFFTISIGIKQYIFISIILFKPDIYQKT